MKRLVLGLLLTVAACTPNVETSSTSSSSSPGTTDVAPLTSTSYPTTTSLPEPLEPLAICSGYPSGYTVPFDAAALEEYAEAHRGEWGGWWVAGAFGEGPVIAVVTDRVEEHEVAIKELVTEAMAVEVREGRFTLDELDAAASALDGRDIPLLLEVFASRWQNQVLVAVVADTPEVRKATEGLDPDLYCLAPHTGPVTPWGEQPQEGEVWRLLGESLAAPSYRVLLAASAQGHETMWNRYFSGPLPEVDLRKEVVVYIGGVVSTGCPQIFLEDLFVDFDGRVVYPLLSHPGIGGCLRNALPHGYALAVDRSSLPDRFRLQFGSEPFEYPGDVRDLEVDLTNPDQDLEVWGRPGVSVRVRAEDPQQYGPLSFRFYDENGRLVLAPEDVFGEGGDRGDRGPYTVVAGDIHLEATAKLCHPDGCDAEAQTLACEIDLPLTHYQELTISLYLPDPLDPESCALSGIDARQIDGVWVFSHTPYFYMQALHSGVPEIVDGCLVVGDMLVVWPEQLLDDAAQAVAAAREGSSVPITLGGGGSGGDQPLEPDEIAPVLRRCSTTAVWFAAP